MILRRVMLSVLLMASAAYAQDASPILTASAVREQVDAGQYREALKSLLRILDLKGVAAAPYDRSEMLMLRAECQLQIRETKAALVSLDAALKEAAAQSKPDDAGTAMALTLLVQKSPGLQYTPKSNTGPLKAKPLNILDRAVRPEAYKALFEDELAAVRQKVRTAEAANTMAPILDAAKAAGALRAVEKAASGMTQESQELTDDLSRHAAALLTAAVSDMSNTVDTLAASANEVVALPVQRYDPLTRNIWIDQELRRRGISSDETQTLKNIQQTSAQIITAANDLGVALGGSDLESYKQITNNAGTLRQRAATVLNDNYNNSVVK